MPQDIGLFIGSFDPFHNGHLNLAIEIFEKSSFHSIWVVPSYSPPNKPQLLNSYEHRLEMARLACKGIPFLTVSDCERELSTPVYTIDMLKQIQSEKYRFTLILADELLSGLPFWKDSASLVENYDFAIGIREGKEFPIQIEDLNFSSSQREKLKKNIVFTRNMKISSTEIRQRIFQKKYCQHLTQPQVLAYIDKNALYSNNLN